MGLCVLGLLFVPLRLARDFEIGEQHGMEDDFAECRTGELIHDQRNALPHRLDRRAPLRTQTDKHVLFVAGNVRNMRETIKPPLFSCRRSTPDSSLLLPLYAALAWVNVPCPTIIRMSPGVRAYLPSTRP